MNNIGGPSTSKADNTFEDDEIFDDSAFLANFENSSFKQTKVSERIVNVSINNSVLNVSALCCDEEINGYDKLTGRTWIYPTNYPVRDYQFNIIKAAILQNTLVSLPTGLGKTFIAAVIMYNFYRWYPLGKIVFTAPTRPLVAQQIDACYNIIAIPPSDTIEMTGHMQVNTRKAHWQNKRVFFATPQVIYNDLKSGICPADKIRCLVIDEAHRARGNYAYCQIVATLDDMGCKTYRMLALSATPGSKVEDVINVVRSLHIAHLELRTESCIDVAPYSHSRKINTVIVQLGPELSQLRQQYVEILDGYARRLKQFNILPQNLGNLSKGRIVMLYKEYQTKDRGARHPQHNYIMKDFTLLIALYHGLELLVKHGSRVFLNFFDEHPEKSWIQSDDKLTALLERLRDDLGVNPLSLDRSILPDGTIPEMPKDLCFGHPKFDKLKSIMLEHFNNAKRKEQDTRAIGKDGKTVVSQKQQLRVMRSFREGICNTLVATCVAEEGLDVGSVDLILCFDISTRSPIRLVQRCGRTGRERGGQVFILVTEGREHQTLMDCMRQRDGLNKKILQSKEVEKNLYKLNPRMMPHGFTPECQKMYITVAKKDDKETAEKASKKGQKDLRSMLLNKASASSSGSSLSSKGAEKNCLITKEEFNALFPDGYRETNYLRKAVNYWAMSKEAIKSDITKLDQDKRLNLSSWLEWQRSLQKTVNIGHSKDSELLSTILQKCDAKRLEPTQNTQNLVTNTPELPSQNTLVIAAPSPVKSPVKSPAKLKQTKKKQKAPIIKSPAKNYGDIRALFSTATKSTKSYTKLINDLGIQNDGNVPTRLINLLVDLNLNITNNVKKCYICENICKCKVLRNVAERKAPVLLKFLEEPELPDLDLIDDMDVETIVKCRKGDATSRDLSEVKNATLGSTEDKINLNTNFELEFDFDGLDELKSPEDKAEDNEMNLSTDKNFDIGDIDDIFADSSPETATEKVIGAVKEPEIVIQLNNVIEEKNEPEEVKEALGFFGLDSIDDIFADYDDDDFKKVSSVVPKSAVNGPTSSIQTLVRKSVEISPVKEIANIIKVQEEIVATSVKEATKTVTQEPVAKKKTIIEPLQDKNVPNSEYPVSPSILSGKLKVRDIPTSPILCSEARRFPLSTKKNKPQCSTPNIGARKKLLLPEADKNNVIVIDDEKEHKSISNNIVNTTDKSMFTITQLVEMINKSDDKSVVKESKTSTKINEDSTVNINQLGRSNSPILLSQIERSKAANLINSRVDRNKSVNLKSSESKNLIPPSKSVSLIILDSDSDSSDTEIYDFNDETSKTDAKQVTIDDSSQTSSKRKFVAEENVSITASPYFNKKQKLDNDNSKLLKEKVLAAITSNKAKDFSNNQKNCHCAVSQTNFFSQKENKNPENTEVYNNIDDEKEAKKCQLDMIQKYRKECKILTLRKKFDSIFRKSPKKPVSPHKSSQKKNSFEEYVNNVDDKSLSPKLSQTYLESFKKNISAGNMKIVFDESDDDFIVDDKNRSPKKTRNKNNGIRTTTNHKVRKKKRKGNSFIEMEASLSDDGSDSGDELTDDSAGSIAEFICDDADDTRQEDIHAVYLKSVRSPVKKNGFKIPELPNHYKREDVFSQFVVEEDAYEMDSFCVDSHIGLTQLNDVSELELAEIILEEKRRKKKTRHRSTSPQENGESPLVRRKVKNAKRQIHSDSDDSS